MEYINLGAVIEQAIARFGQNRIGERPPVFLVGSSTLPDVPWHDQSLKQFVRLFLYECLLTNDPDAAVRRALALICSGSVEELVLYSSSRLRHSATKKFVFISATAARAQGRTSDQTADD
jgi:hypothetical protein